jgi:hypothetical protein
MKFARRRPSPALVIACLALAVALGGTSYAAVSLPANSVGTKQLKNNAVVASKVKRGSLRIWNFAESDMPKGDRGADGLPGPKGDKGDKGDPATKLFAVVDDNGDLIKGTQGASSKRNGGAGSGSYTVTFPQNVTDCAAIATTKETDGGGQVAASAQGGDANDVSVGTFSPDGNGHQDMKFAVAVFC